MELVDTLRPLMGRHPQHTNPAAIIFPDLSRPTPLPRPSPPPSCSDVGGERELIETVGQLQAAVEQVVAALCVFLARDPVTLRDARGRAPRAAPAA